MPVPRALRQRVAARQRTARRDAQDAALALDALLRREATRGKPPTAAALYRRLEGLLGSHLRQVADRAHRGWRRAMLASLPRGTAGRAADAGTVARLPDNALAGRTWRARLRAHAGAVAKAVRAARRAKTPEARDAALARAGRARAALATLARTEVGRVDNAAATLAVRGAAGDRITGWRYTTQGDARVRPAHRRREGKVFRLGQRRIRLPDGPNCRCYYLPVLRAGR